ncbi:MAP3K12-binding inhibitory protein 1 isoform X2 [Petromyzon marinus]|uniref:MAP3K12-binding inhibitory protein 1 isoform X2 n=2 Tax=Petromyzon marinus TaxID=7757 RepID=UPI003F716396
MPGSPRWVGRRWRRFESQSDGVTTAGTPLAAAAAVVEELSASRALRLALSSLSFADPWRSGSSRRKMSRATEPLARLLRSVARFVQQLGLSEDAVKLCINYDKLGKGCGLDTLSQALQVHMAALNELQQKLGEANPEPIDVDSPEPKPCVGKRPEASPPTAQPKTDDLEPKLVQIQARKAEIDRRIMAFMERKQLEVNENNIREFCNVINSNQENSCARTDAVFTPRPGSISHIKVSRVVNTYGPQTQQEVAQSGRVRGGNASEDCGNSAVEERLQNLEEHLRLRHGGPVPGSVYARLKELENRVLQLEGSSPEYFESINSLKKRKKVHDLSQKYTLSDLDAKINVLRAMLLKKSTDAPAQTMDVDPSNHVP